MGESEKHPQIGTIASDLKTLFPVISTRRRTKLFVYGFVVAFVACTAFLAFSSSGNASPWFNTLFTSSSYSSSSISAAIAPYKSQFSSIVSYLFPNSSETPISPAQKPNNQSETRVGSPKDGILEGINGASEKNRTEKIVGSQGNGVSEKNRTETGVGSKKDGILAGKNKTVTGNGSHGIEVSSKGKPEGGSVGRNQTGSGISFQGSGVPASNQKDPKASSNHKEGVLAKNETTEGATLNPKKSEAPAGEPKGVKAGDRISNSTPPATKPGNLAASASKADDRKREEWIDKMMGCDIFQGRWVRDESYPLYKEGSCPHIDEPFDCHRNGRPDRVYQKLRWQPNGCNIPRLNGTDMLERLRGKRLVFVGDSLNRNMWESLVCVLRNSVKDKKKVFEASGKSEFKTQGSYSFLFKDYGCTVEFYRSPFLVQEWEMPGNNGTKKETLRLDIFQSSASKYKDAHVIIFNTGHWWTHDKTSKGRDYYQEGNRVYSELNVAEAFHKALNTWAKWVDTNVNPKKSLVFFRGYSASHFSGGRWNSGGQCDRETEPIKNETYLSSYPPKMGILEKVIKGMKTPVSYLNITRMTDYRKDAHPSIYRKQKLSEEEKRSPERYQDCSHWCLPGVPDSWNELLYAQILIKQHQMRL